MPSDPPPESATDALAQRKVDLDHLKELLIQLVQSASPAVQDDIDQNRTLAVGLVEDIDENGVPVQRLFYTASGNWKRNLDALAERLDIERGNPDPREKGKREATKAAADAEQLFIELDVERFVKPIALAVYRRPCEHCANAIENEGLQVKWLTAKERKVATGAGRVYRRGSGEAKKAVEELHAAFAPSTVGSGQASTGIGADAPLWSALNGLNIQELYAVLEVAQDLGKLRLLQEAAPHARKVYNNRILAVMATLAYKAELQKPTPSDSALLGGLNELYGLAYDLPNDQKEFLRAVLRPTLRKIRKVRRQDNKTEKTHQKDNPKTEIQPNTGIGAAILKALKIAGVAVSTLVAFEIAEAVASALFMEFLLILAEKGWKAVPKQRIAEIVGREVRKRVQTAPEQAKRIAEIFVEEIEHIEHAAEKATGM